MKIFVIISVKQHMFAVDFSHLTTKQAPVVTFRHL